MGFKCGIVGLPNVGKSSLFNALTDANIASENYPFCTIEPNSGIVPVPDPRLNEVASIAQSAKILPATMEFIDIAGLVSGASKGQGLGNKFLSHIRETDAILHVVRLFDDDNITHVTGAINPLDDVEIVETELALADLDTCTRALDKAERNSKSGDKTLLSRAKGLRYLVSLLEKGVILRKVTLEKTIEDLTKDLGLLISKPVLFVSNVGENDLLSNEHYEKLLGYANSTNAECLAICAALESEIITLPHGERIEYLKASGLSEPGLNRLIRAGYKLLQLQSFFTAGPKESRAWTIPVGSYAPTAAGAIHGDFEKGFIRAEVIGYDDFVGYGGEQGAKERGKLRSEGKDYIVADGDVMHFRFNL